MQIVGSRVNALAIENSFHWALDAPFGKMTPTCDTARVLRIWVLTHLALNILKQDQTNSSLKQKHFWLGVDDSFLQKLLAQV